MSFLEKLFNLNMLLNMMLTSAAITVTIMFSKNIASILSLQETSCIIEKVSYAKENATCPCGFFCRSKFPCVRLFVNFQLNHSVPQFDSSSFSGSSIGANDNIERLKPLRQDLHTITFAPECTFSSLDICYEKSEEDKNIKQVEDIVKSLQVVKTFPCYYKPSNTSYVILSHRPSPSEISTWMSICWGVTAIFGATSIVLCWVLGACGFWQKTVKKVVPFENENTLKEKQEKKRQKLIEELKV